jgi:SAM-dependent methyltransferase
MTIAKSPVPYNKYYKKRTHVHVYPVEFVVRTLLGSYPNLEMNRDFYSGSKLLDLGYGDGRNMPLFHNIGFKIFGMEISEEINKLARERLEILGIDGELKVGHNNSIPYQDQFFDFIIACHSCYYVNEDRSFNDNLHEISRVLKTEGVFIASLPMRDNFIFNDAEFLSDGHYRITKDPYGIRNGTIHKTFLNEDEIIETFEPYYKDLSIGYINDNYYGINVKMWIIKATRK